MQQVAPRELASWLHDEPLVLLDVREAWEVAVSPFPNAMHVPMREIPARVDELPAQQAILLSLIHI